MHGKFLIILGCFLVCFSRLIAQEACSEFVQTALATAQEQCAALGRNQACYGNVALTAVGQADASNFQFAGVGDIIDVAAIKSMQLSGYDPENGVWGLVMMQLQANIPNTLPGQNVTVLLFGDVAVQNAATSVSAQNSPEQELVLASSSDVSVRALPSDAAQTLGTISPNTTVIATGISEDNLWVRIRFGAETGWLAVQFFGDTFDPSSLMLVSNPTEPVFAPMQAFYLTAGIGRPSCNQVPDDGMLVQTPQGVASINLIVNEVSVQMGSTVYFSFDEDGDLDISPIKGSARVETAHGESHTLVEGTWIEVPMNDEFLPDGAPSEPSSYLGNEDIADLPIELLEEAIEPDLGLTEEEAQAFEALQPLLDFVDVEDADDLFNYLEETENPDLVDYLIDEGYSDFGDDLETFIQEDLGYDLDNYEDYAGDETDDNGESDDNGDGYQDSGEDNSSNDEPDNSDSTDDSGEGDDGGGDDGGE